MPKHNSRDEFSASVVRDLRERAGNVCSLCSVSTLGPKSGPRGVLIQGIAAHVHAASPGGPRAAPHLTREERSAYENGIWLCNGCANLIDRDPVHYPAAALTTLKLQREMQARATLGRRPGEQEGQHQMIAAMSGFPTLGTSPSLIANAHRATERFLEGLDPRVEIRTRYENGRTTILLRAREPVSFTLLAPPTHRREWEQGFNQVVTHGSGTITLKGARAEGSLLLAYLVDEAGSLEISTMPRPATLQLDLQSSAGEVWSFVQTQGHAVAGSHSAVYEGRAWGGLFSIRLPVPLAPTVAHESLTFTIDFDGWAGRPLTEMPYTGKIAGFATKLGAGWRPRLTLEVEGQHSFSFLGGADPEVVESLEIYRYLHACVRLAGLARSNATFRPSAGISRRNLEEVLEAVDAHDPAVSLTGKDFQRPILLRCPAGAPALSSLMSTTDLLIRAREAGPMSMSVWDQTITLPRREWLCVRARLIVRDDIATEPAYQTCELVFDEDAPVTMLPVMDASTL